MVKIVFVDIDGTLFDSKSNLSKTNKIACKQAQENNIPIVVNTGRCGINAVKIAKMISADKFKGFAIGNDGAEIWSFSEKEWIFLSQIQQSTLKKLTNWIFLQDKDFIINFNCIDSIYINRFYDKWEEWLKYLKIKITKYRTVEDIKEPVSKVIIVLEHYWDSHQFLTFFANFEKEFPDLSIVQYHANVFSIGNKGVSKGSAIGWLCNYLNINTKNAMAIGDSFNDLAMLESVGYPVVMDNAHEAIKSYAKWIAANNDNDGVKSALIEYLIIN